MAHSSDWFIATPSLHPSASLSEKCYRERKQEEKTSFGVIYIIASRRCFSRLTCFLIKAHRHWHQPRLLYRTCWLADCPCHCTWPSEFRHVQGGQSRAECTCCLGRWVMDLSLYIDKHHLCANMDPYAAVCSPLSETDRHQNNLHGYGVGALSIRKTAMQCNQVSSCCCCCCFVVVF